MVEVTVLMASYNVAPFIEHALRSTLAQTLRDIEVLVVDDGSSDGTRAIVEAMAREDRRVRLLCHEHNRGPSAARNTGLAVARGHWIAIVDSDDWMAPHRLERLTKLAQARGADWIADDIWIETGTGAAPLGRILVGEPPGCSEVDIGHLIRRDQPESQGYGLLKPVIRREFLAQHRLRYRPEMDRIEDFILNVECAAAGARHYLLAEPLYHYRRRHHSMTRMPPLPTLTIALRGNQLAADLLQPLRKPTLDRVLEDRAARIEQAIRYRQIIEPIKSGHVIRGLRQLARDPAITGEILRGLTRGAVRRLKLARHARSDRWSADGGQAAAASHDRAPSAR